jgi:hypothetical protein
MADIDLTNYTAEQKSELLKKVTAELANRTSGQGVLGSATQELASRVESGKITPSVAEQPKDTTPINVADITQDKTIPDKALDTNYDKTSTTSADSISSLIAKQDEKLQADKASAQSALSKAGLTGTGNTLEEQLITGYQTKAPQADYQGTLQQYQSQYGVTNALDEYKLQGEKVVQMKAAVENLDLQRQAELDATLNRQASMNSISAEQQRINQKYDSQRAKLVGDYNVEAAVLAAKSNNLSEANNLVSQAVNAYTADISAEIKRFDNLYSIASDWVSSLTSQEQSILDDAKNNLITQKKDEEERLTNVLNLKLEYPSAGIEASDTLEQATAKAEKIAGSDAELNRQLKEAQLTEAQDTTDTETQLATLYAQAQTLASSKGVSTIEAIASLPVSQDLKTNLLFFNSFTGQLEEEAKQEEQNRVNVEEVTPTLIQELLNSYDLPTIKAMAKDETVLVNIEKAYKELSTQKSKENLSVAGSAIGSTAKGIVDFFSDSEEETSKIADALSLSTGEKWYYDNGVYKSASNKIKTKTQVAAENTFRGFSENVISPFLTEVKKAFED